MPECFVAKASDLHDGDRRIVVAGREEIGVFFKGGGEAGITPSSAVLINAVLDALSELGIEHIDMPATPQRVWRAIRDARNGAMQGPEG